MAVDLAYQELGDPGAPALVILHGLFGSGRNWRSVGQRLARGRRVVLADARNHGASPRAPGMDYRAQAADVERLMDRLGIGRAALLGHSMGGKTAMTLALTRPERVERLVVADIAPVRYGHSFEDLLAAMESLDLGHLGSRREADAGLAAHIGDAALRAFLLTNLDGRPGQWRWRVDLPAIHAALPQLLDFPAVMPGRPYPGPALFVAGGASHYVRPEHEARIRALFPQARIARIEGAGHWLHAERPEAFLALVEPFLAA
ncbi:alpha/beta fold hydrolase [Inmirania thermothiophila]|uniref:Pimeloyl-ACP methyl ester carboxylesterase n=1 Tax=Inmirania thermothiophila TaxID=1750597 RepID=A0A3N1Y8E9_9GAMM|nr:alpha/beta fold hydrolase [Inmirania thermothiophila]ROR35040.1 pimeloyl-ACP methyl ester carboxylesterase [Inmirania thermothiophila]